MAKDALVLYLFDNPTYPKASKLRSVQQSDDENGYFNLEGSFSSYIYVDMI